METQCQLEQIFYQDMQECQINHVIDFYFDNVLAFG